MTYVIPSQSHDISSFLMPVVQLIYSSSVEAYLLWKCSFNYVSSMLHMCSISIKCDVQSKAWDILLVLTSVAGNLCNKCPNGYSNKTAVKVILSMQSLVSIEQQSPRRPCDIKLCKNMLQAHCDIVSVILQEEDSISILEYNSTTKPFNSFPDFFLFENLELRK